MVIHNRGHLVKYMREQKGLSQTECAKLVGIKQGYLSGIENNQKTPSTAILESLAKVLGFKVGEYFEGRKC